MRPTLVHWGCVEYLVGPLAAELRRQPNAERARCAARGALITVIGRDVMADVVRDLGPLVYVGSCRLDEAGHRAYRVLADLDRRSWTRQIIEFALERLRAEAER